MAIEKYETRWGTVYHRPTCKDDWKNIVVSVSKRKDGSYIPFTALKLQEPAIKSIRGCHFPEGILKGRD